LRGKVVLVGATAAGLGDLVPTPNSGSGRTMAGVEVHANVYDALRRGDAIYNLRPLAGAAVAAVLVIGLMTWMLLTEPRVAMFGAFLFSAGGLLLAWLGVQFGRVWFGPAAGVLGCLLAHPLWSWRRLEATQRYLDAELAALARESGSPGLPPVRDAHGVMDPLQRRLDIVRMATRQQRSVRRFIRDTLEYLPIGVVVMDRRGEVVLHNRRSRFLLDAADPEGLRAALIAMEWPADTVLEGKLPRVGEEQQGALQLELDGPKSRRMLVTVAGLADESGGRLGRVFGLADVSTSYEARCSREETMNFLSHDIRAPLASILTLVEAQQYDPALAEIFVPRVEQYARSALDLADGLFRLVRAENADPSQFALLDLAGLLEVASEEVWALARAKAIKVEVDVRISLVEECFVRGDGALLQRAVVNLLTNAIKYSPAGTRVGLSLSSEPGMWAIRVSDQGEGISQDSMPLLFKRFSRLQGRRVADPGGVGLGLLIVKTIVERHGGEVQVHSEVGVGSTFEIRLPKAAGT
ncbi:MAG: CHASE2 domain-containing protein, partial [Zoogloea sp.]|nr:CHASE2 domain-containing protein [Zoogloea sp.]